MVALGRGFDSVTPAETERTDRAEGPMVIFFVCSQMGFDLSSI